ncbi:MAG: hypothetical protein ABL906_00310 [Sideroxydans sp.]
MKTKFFAVVVLLSVIGIVTDAAANDVHVGLSENVSPIVQQDKLLDCKPWCLVLGFGTTFADDANASINHPNVGRINIPSQSGILLSDLRVGAEFRLDDNVSISGGVGWHEASNGDKSPSFNSTQMEVMGHYYLSEKYRLGGGAHFIQSANYKDSTGVNDTFKGSPSMVLEVEWFPTSVFESKQTRPSILGVKLRQVIGNKFKSDSYPSETFNGDYFGVFITLYALQR